MKNGERRHGGPPIRSDFRLDRERIRDVFTSRLGVAFVVLMVGWPIVAAGLVTIGSATASATGIGPREPTHTAPFDLTPETGTGTPWWWSGPTILQGKITPDGDLVLPIIPSFAGYDALYDGDTLFGSTLQIYVYDLHDYSQSLALTVYQNVSGNGTGGNSVVHETFVVLPLSVNVVTINLPVNSHQVTQNLTVDGVSWVYYQLTPVSLIPFATNVGGLDLLAIVILSETVVFTCPLIMLARFLTRRAIYFPKFSMLIWGHVIVIGLLFLFFADYQWLDQTFGGVSYLIYPIVISFLFFLWSLSLFNRAEVVEILKPDVMSGHRLRYLRWTQLVGETKDGRTVVIDPRWRGSIYGLLGHFATLIPAESEATMEGAPAGADVENRETMAAHELAKRDKKLRRKRPSKEKPEDDFRIVNAVDTRDPVKIYWVDSDQPVAVEFPHLSFHHIVEVPEKVDKNGVTIPKHPEKKLTWPHIVDGESTIRLAGIHYLDAPLAALGWSRAEDDFALLEKRAYAVYVLRSRIHSEAERMTEERLAEVLLLIEKGEIPMTEEEAWAATERRRDPRDPRDDIRPDLDRLRQSDRRGRP